MWPDSWQMTCPGNQKRKAPRFIYFASISADLGIRSKHIAEEEWPFCKRNPPVSHWKTYEGEFVNDLVGIAIATGHISSWLEPETFHRQVPQALAEKCIFAHATIPLAVQSILRTGINSAGRQVIHLMEQDDDSS